MSPKTRLVVFLGNPGSEYRNTRHNSGWMVAEVLSAGAKLAWRSKFKGSFATASGVNFLKPETLMNRSGESVGACASYFHLTPAEILVVHDDIELAFGRVEIKSGGGLGGHNGLRDIVRVVGSGDFSRLRIGVSRPTRGTVSSYVLSRFSPAEEQELPRVLEEAARLVAERTGLPPSP